MRGEVHEPQHAQGQQEPTERDPGPAVRARLRGHEHHAHDGQQHGQHDRAAAHDVPDARRDAAPDRTARPEPDPGRADDGEHEQRDAETVAAVRGIDLPGAAERAAGGPAEPGDAATDRVDPAVDEIRALPGRRPALTRRTAGAGPGLGGRCGGGHARREARPAARPSRALPPAPPTVPRCSCSRCPRSSVLPPAHGSGDR